MRKAREPTKARDLNHQGAPQDFFFSRSKKKKESTVRKLCADLAGTCSEAECAFRMRSCGREGMWDVLERTGYTTILRDPKLGFGWGLKWFEHVGWGRGS